MAKMFWKWKNLTEDDEKVGWHTTLRNDSLIAQVKDIIHVNHHLTIQKVAEETGISIGSCHAILA
jgi:AraC-like DNA-binding protein